MDAEGVVEFIVGTLAGVEEARDGGNWFLFVGSGRKMPFVTVVVGDFYDTASDLGREGVYRVNIGVGRERYEGMFGALPKFRTDGGVAETGHDFRKLDEVMPHPIYAAMGWVCVLNPQKRWEQVKGLIGEAHGRAGGAGERIVTGG